MISISIHTTFEQLYNFLDNNFVLLLSEHKLYRPKIIYQKIISIKQNKLHSVISDTVFYFEKNEKKAQFIIIARERVGSKTKNYHYGACVLKINNDLKLFIDTEIEAIKKGIIQKEFCNQNLKILTVIAIIGVIICAFIMSCIFIAALACLPLVLLNTKRQLKYRQKVMNTIISIFEKEFSVSDRKDSNDKITFWGTIISDVKDDFLPK